MSSSEWKLVGNPKLLTDRAKALHEEALLAAPADFMKEDVASMFPRKKIQGKCRICGKTASLTKEHIPPQRSGNQYRTIKYSVPQWLKDQELNAPQGGRKEQGGVFGHTLCGSCNSSTGTKYGGEYKKWSLGGIEALKRLPRPEDLDKDMGPWCMETKTVEGLKPGAFVRQVLAMMCSLSGTWDIAERHPEIRRIILDRSTVRLPKNINLNMTLYLGPRLRYSGPQIRVDIARDAWQWVMEIAYPPYSFLMTLASNKEKLLDGAIMNDWVSLEPTEEGSFEGEIGLGFGWTPLPGDYRSRARIMLESSQLA